MGNTMKKYTENGCRAMLCGVLQQAAEDWHALRRAGIVDDQGDLTGQWPRSVRSKRCDKLGTNAGNRQMGDWHSDGHEDRAAVQQIQGPVEAMELKQFLTSRACRWLCHSVGVSHAGMLRGLRIPLLARDAGRVCDAPLTLKGDGPGAFEAAKKRGLIGMAPKESIPHKQPKREGRRGVYIVDESIPRDREMLEWRVKRGMNQHAAAEAVGITCRMWARREILEVKREFQLPE